MSGFLKTVSRVAAVVAQVAALIPGGQVVAAVAAAVAIVASIGAALTAKKPQNARSGQQTQFKIDPGGPLTYPMGRTSVGGTVVHRATYGDDNHYETYFASLGFGGPFAGIEALTMDRVVVPRSGSGVAGYYQNWLWCTTQLGEMPTATALTNGIIRFGSPVAVPGWTAAHNLSGHLAASLTYLFDTKGKRYTNGQPVPGFVINGSLVYDPRLDSTYPGGAGPCRWADPRDAAAFAAARETWVYSETPALHGLMWRLGIWAGTAATGFKRAMGIGAAIAAIQLPAIVAAANVQEANGWKIGGQVDSAMDKWNALKLIEEAGGAVPIASAARMSTLQRAPRVPLATITSADLADGGVTVPGMVPRKTRLNGYRARIRSEAHGWEMTDLDIVQAGEYVTADRGEKTGSGDFALVQEPDQGASLAAYAMFDSRELTGIVLPLKPRWAEYRVGECLSLDIPELLLTDLDVIIKGRSIDPATGKVTLTLDTETPGKHAVALGQTGTLPPPPTIGLISDEVAAPNAGDWTATPTTYAPNGASIPAIVVGGTVGNGNASEWIVEYRQREALLNEDGSVMLKEDNITPILSEALPGDWNLEGIFSPVTPIRIVSPLVANGVYEIAISYRVRGVVGDRLVLGPVVASALTVSRGALQITGLDPEFPVSSDDSHLFVEAFTATIDAMTMQFPAGTIGGLAASTRYTLFWRISTASYEVAPAPALAQKASSDLIIIENHSTLNSLGEPPPRTAPPPGYDGTGPRELVSI